VILQQIRTFVKHHFKKKQDICKTDFMFINRKIYSELKQMLKYDEIIVLTGMRRVGKTTLLKKLYNEVDSDNKFFWTWKTR